MRRNGSSSLGQDGCRLLALVILLLVALPGCLDGRDGAAPSVAPQALRPRSFPWSRVLRNLHRHERAAVCEETPWDLETSKDRCSDLSLSAGIERGFVPEVLFDERWVDRVYATAGGRAYLSDNGGSTFEAPMVTPGLSIHTLTHLPNTSMLYAGTNRGLARSVDDGVHFTPLSLAGVSIRLVMVHPADNSHIYVALNTGVLLRSVDGGRNFVPLHGLPFGNLIEVIGDPNNANRVLVAVQQLNAEQRPEYRGGIWATDDGGAHFAPVYDDHGQPSQAAVCASDSSVIVVAHGESSELGLSRDGGRSFDFVTVSREGISSVAISGEQCEVLYASAPLEGVFRSVDSGARFELLPRTGVDMAALGPRRIAVSPHDPDLLFAMYGGGMFRSVDGGRSFALVAGVGANTIRDLRTAADGSVLVATWGAGVFRNPDLLSASFERISAEALPTDYAFSAAALGDRLLVGAMQELYVSEDSGGSFQKGEPCNFTDYLAGEADADDILAATYVCGVMRSTDGGRSFEPDNAGLPFVDLGDGVPYGAATVLLRDPQIPSRVYVGRERDGIYMRDGDGPFQHSLSLAAQRINCLETDGQRIFACVDGLGVAVSEDHGASFRYLNEGLATRVVSDLQWYPAGQRLYLSTPDGIYQLEGERWELQDTSCARSANRLALGKVGTQDTLLYSSGGHIYGIAL